MKAAKKPTCFTGNRHPQTISSRAFLAAGTSRVVAEAAEGVL
jgi:hypothetical protein